MIKQSIFEQYIESPQRQRIIEQERVLVDAAELVSKAMEFRCVTRTDLANKLDHSKAYVTQVLRGNQNLTLKTLADVLHVLNCRLILAAATETGVIFNRPWTMEYAGNSVATNEYRPSTDVCRGMAA